MWNIPIHWLNKEVARKIGAVLGQVQDIIIPSAGSREGRHIKVLVEIDLNIVPHRFWYNGRGSNDMHNLL